MIERIISDCEQALDHNLYFAALSLALTLPDICAKAKYPNEKNNKKRYVNWYEEYIGQYEKSPRLSYEPDGLPYPNGEVIYSLRCSMLHQGTPNVEANKCNITKFELIVEKKKPLDIYACNSYGISYHEDEQNNKIITAREIRLNVRNLCWKICTVARHYYEENKELFDFFNYHVIDWDKEMEQDRYLYEQNQQLQEALKGKKDDET